MFPLKYFKIKITFGFCLKLDPVKTMDFSHEIVKYLVVRVGFDTALLSKYI